MPIRRRQGGRAATGWPWISIRPADGAMKPAIMRRSVVLPQPEGPRMVRKAPRVQRQGDVVDRAVVADSAG